MHVDVDKAKQREEQDNRINQVLKKIQKRIVIFSGKGGVY